MTRLHDDPHRFTEDMLAGFLDVHTGAVTGVEGGVVRKTETRPGKVAVVVGGGSGHYPAFCGVVGPGFADGAVVGSVFTSPSTTDAVSVARAVSSGAGVLFSTGNYAGDVLNFTLAQEQLAREGVQVRVVFVTDDIASAPVDEVARRRGIAGDFVVFKVAGAAAEQGYDLDGVERVASRANDVTRTLGVAFGGCTLPGAATPLFTVPEGEMGVGLGIHGEPGVSQEPLPRAADLARRLVDGVLAERPPGSGDRVAAILNGLGSTKYEELFVVWGTVSTLLRDAGLTVVEPEVGELVTSLDMAGCSLTLTFLDDELEQLWCAPADAPAYQKGRGAFAATGATRTDGTPAAAVSGPAATYASAASQALAAAVARALEAARDAMVKAQDELGRIDAVAGDGDHGRGMVKGTAAAAAAARTAAAAGAGARSTLVAAGEAWAAKAGGTSGVLWGAALSAAGTSLCDDVDLDGPAAAAAVRAALDAVVRLGSAKPGDKTMVDAWAPFADALDQAVAQSPLAEAWATATAVAGEAADATAALRPRLGRARPLAERSIGTPDAGATSFVLLARAVAAALAPDHTSAPSGAADRGA